MDRGFNLSNIDFVTHVIYVTFMVWETAFVRQTCNHTSKERTCVADCNMLFGDGLRSWVSVLYFVEVKAISPTTW